MRILGAVFLLVAITTSCSLIESRHSTTSESNPWFFEGWACKPQSDKRSPALFCPSDPQDTRNEYVYLKHELKVNTVSDAVCETEMKRALSTPQKANSIAIPALAAGVTDFYPEAPNNPLENFTDVGVLGCCLLDPKTNRCQTSGSAKQGACLCVFYGRYPGGRTRFAKEFWIKNKPYIDCECHP